MPLRRLVLLALVAGALLAFVAAMLRPRHRPHMLAIREEIMAAQPLSAPARTAAKAPARGGAE